MSKEEFLKIRTCMLKVNIHCDGCKKKVKKTLQKVEGVYKIHVDSELGKVTVSGNVDPAALIKKLTKSGKHAEVWGAPTKSLQVAGNGDKHQKQIQPPPKGGGGGGGGKSGPTAQQFKQVQQLQKGFQDLKMPQLKMPAKGGGGQSQKTVRFAEDNEFIDDDDEFDDDEFSDEDDEFDGDMSNDDLDDAHHRRDLSKMKPEPANGSAPKGPTMMGKGAPPPGGNFNGSVKNGGGGGANQNQNQNHGVKKGGRGGKGADKNDHQMGGGGGKMQMNHNQMGNFQAAQGLPAPPPNGSMAYFQGGSNPDTAAANPYLQQQLATAQLATAMMNQPRAMGNERFQPMIYARPPPAINYAHSAYPPHYPYQPPPSYDRAFSDDSASGCRVM